MRCFLWWHSSFEPWRIRAEVPLWQINAYGRNDYAAGNQPRTLRNFLGADGKTVYSREAEDLDYRLVGKLVEQVRRCEGCGLVQLRWKKVTV